jgi:hypothetical protein
MGEARVAGIRGEGADLPPQIDGHGGGAVLEVAAGEGKLVSPGGQTLRGGQACHHAVLVVRGREGGNTVSPVRVWDHLVAASLETGEPITALHYHAVRTLRFLWQRSFLFSCDCTKCHTEVTTPHL